MTERPTCFHRVDGVSYVDRISVDSLVRRWPTPVIVYSAATLRANVAAARAAFPADTALLYSYKACYLPAVLRVLHAAGLDAEVCSAREYRLAVGLGLPASRIVWNAVTLDWPDIALAVSGGTRWLGLNTLTDIVRMDVAARSSGRRVDVALRLHPEGITSSYLEAGSRLGLDVADGTASRAVDLVLRSENLRLVGVHSHTQVQQVRPDLHAQCLRSLLAFVAATRRATGYQLRRVGLGGGLSCRAEMRRGDTDVGTFGSALAIACNDLDPDVRLVLEPGRFFVSDAAVGFTRVISRTAARGSAWLMVDLGTQVLVPFEGRQFTLDAAHSRGGSTQVVSVGDRLSSYSGVLATKVRLPPVSDGDLLVVSDIGAYTTSVAQRFMFGTPAVVMVDGADADLVHPAEDDMDWVRGLIGTTGG